MRNSRLALSTIALVTGAGLLLSGCSKSSENAAEDNPLEKYFSALSSGEEWTQERFDEQHKAQEEYIAECMTKLGFEYTPDLQNGGMVIGDDDEMDGPQWGTPEFAKEYGYGIVAWPDSMGGSEDDAEEYVDPNGPYVESLTESEQAAYYEALYGPGPSDDELALMEEDENYNWTAADEGCWGEAMQKTNDDPVSEAYEDPEFADLWASLDLLWTDVENDDRIVNLNREWMSCMTDAGFPEFATRDDAQNQLQEEWSAVIEELNANTGENDEWKEPSREDTDAFQQREIDVATADFGCAEKLDWDKVYAEVSNDLSQKFIDAHKTELDAMVAKYGQKK